MRVVEIEGRERMSLALRDTDGMPFGKYGPKPRGSGLTMKEVPASYLHYLWTNGLEHDRQSNVGNYIRTHLEALKKEHPDGIW